MGLMEQAINDLNRDTIVRNNGGVTTNDAMLRFCSLILENSKDIPLEGRRARLEWVSCYSGLTDELKSQVDTMKKEIDKAMSHPTIMESPKVM
jgi:hypothetical protein